MLHKNSHGCGRKNPQSLIVMLLFQNSGMLKGMMQKVNPFKSSAQVRDFTFDVCSQHAASEVKSSLYKLCLKTPQFQNCKALYLCQTPISSLWTTECLVHWLRHLWAGNISLPVWSDSNLSVKVQTESVTSTF